MKKQSNITWLDAQLKEVNDKASIQIPTQHPKNMQFNFFLITNNLKEASVDIQDESEMRVTVEKAKIPEETMLHGKQFELGADGKLFVYEFSGHTSVLIKNLSIAKHFEFSIDYKCKDSALLDSGQEEGCLKAILKPGEVSF